MLEELKAMLGDAASAYTDTQIEVAYRQAQQDAATYCRRKLDDDLLMVAQKMAIVRLHRMNTEGLQGQAISGVNETYVDGYPDDIMMVLKAKRKLKIL